MSQSRLFFGFRLIFSFVFSCLLILAASRLGAQQPTPAQSQDSPAPAAPAKQDAPASAPAAPQTPGAPAAAAKEEVATRDTPTTFKVRVNLVLVRVVVRDSKGKIISNLKKEDFQLYDNKKLQNITSFSVESPESRTASAVASGAGSSSSADVGGSKAVILPQRFVSMVFDDVHLSLQDVAFVRASAKKFFGALAGSDRVAINTTSGQLTQEFTDDHDKLEQVLLGIIPHPIHAHSQNDCPDISYYQADQIVNRQDTQALAIASTEALACAFGNNPQMAAAAQTLASSTAYAVLAEGDGESDYTYRHLEDVMRRLSGMPGQRVLVVVSPGFILSTLELQASEIVDRAVRSNIVINTIDARGLYTPDLLGDVSDPPNDGAFTGGYKATYRVEAQSAQEDVLLQFADGTGGKFYHNRNDVDEAMREAGAAPAYSYLLGFSPQNLKVDGRFHALKVSLNTKEKLEVQARHGYFAPRTVNDPAEATRQEMQEALFSQEEIHDLPMDLQTQFFKKDDAQAKLAVLTHFDVKGIHFQKVKGRNNDQLTILTGIFDENGNFVTALSKVVEMNLLDTTYNRLTRGGLTVKSSFDIKPGTYLVRAVVRDSVGDQMAARNGAVVIPY